jgi:hypothetical protein
MDVAIWGKLPRDILAIIADFADIDTRRALGFPPRKLPPLVLTPWPFRPTIYQYFSNDRRLWYFEFIEYGTFMLEVTTDINVLDRNLPLFQCSSTSIQRRMMASGTGFHLEECTLMFPLLQTFQTAGFPEWR